MKARFLKYYIHSCILLHDIARSMLWEPQYHHRGAFDRVHRGSAAFTLCCKQVCPEVNHVYTALGPLWCRCFSVRQSRVARPPSRWGEKPWEHLFLSWRSHIKCVIVNELKAPVIVFMPNIPLITHKLNPKSEPEVNITRSDWTCSLI